MCQSWWPFVFIAGAGSSVAAGLRLVRIRTQDPRVGEDGTCAWLCLGSTLSLSPLQKRKAFSQSDWGACFRLCFCLRAKCCYLGPFVVIGEWWAVLLSMLTGDAVFYVLCFFRTLSLIIIILSHACTPSQQLLQSTVAGESQCNLYNTRSILETSR